MTPLPARYCKECGAEGVELCTRFRCAACCANPEAHGLDVQVVEVAGVHVLDDDDGAVEVVVRFRLRLRTS